MSTSSGQPWGENVLVEFEDGIAWASMSRPDRKNAISVGLAREMLATMDALETDERCGVFVLTGAGDSWSAGMDLKDYFRATDGMSLVAPTPSTAPCSGGACCPMPSPPSRW